VSPPSCSPPFTAPCPRRGLLPAVAARLRRLGRLARDDPGVNRDELTGRVRALRAQGRSPKQIARVLGLRPAAVAPLIRDIAAHEHADTAEPGITGCWVSPGWSQGLGVGDHPGWPGTGVSSQGASGLVTVLVAREHAGSNVSVCGWLADVYCLGVKDVLGPRLTGRHALPRLVRGFFSAYPSPPLPAPLELARHLVLGAVDYARSLGFEPAPGFGETIGHLGPWEGPSTICFGCDGKPFYIQGPHDNAERIMKTLERSTGRDNHHFLVQA
jgi:hypothetical protein